MRNFILSELVKFILLGIYLAGGIVLYRRLTEVKDIEIIG
jgi:hypothetical protein